MMGALLSLNIVSFGTEKEERNGLFRSSSLYEQESCVVEIAYFVIRFLIFPNAPSI